MKTKTVIEITLHNDFKMYTASTAGCSARGRTQSEAIGDLVYAHPELCGVILERVPGVAA